MKQKALTCKQETSNQHSFLKKIVKCFICELKKQKIIPLDQLTG